MLLDILDILKACRRSRVKVRVYRALVVLKIALLAELAAYAQTTPERVRAVLYGDDRHFRRGSALIALGVAREEKRPEGEAYAITLRGQAAWEPVMTRLAETRGPPEG